MRLSLLILVWFSYITLSSVLYRLDRGQFPLPTLHYATTKSPPPGRPCLCCTLQVPDEPYSRQRVRNCSSWAVWEFEYTDFYEAYSIGLKIAQSKAIAKVELLYKSNSMLLSEPAVAYSFPSLLTGNRQVNHAILLHRNLPWLHGELLQRMVR